MGRYAKAHREWLFNQGVRARQRATGDDREVYVCPLCEECGFTRAALETDPPLLSLEDVPSKAAGGRPLVLTCRDCNSTAGAGIDKAVAARAEAQRITDALLRKQGTHERPAKMQVDGVWTNVDVTITPKGTTIAAPRDRNNPDTYEEEIARWYAGRGAGTLRFNLNFQVPGYDERKARLGDLKAAYLAGFAVFGYNWAFHPRLHTVRRQLREPETVLIEHAWLHNRGQREGVFIMKAPVECLAVSFNSYDVILPWITGPQDVYAAVRSSFNVETFTATCVAFGWPKRPEMLIDFDPKVPPGALEMPAA